MRIGVFDSGIGGLTVLKELIKRHPKNEYIYFGDTLNAPYGDKTYEELLNHSNKIISFLKEEKVEAIVLACGTLCSTVFEQLKQNSDIPIYNIIEPNIAYIKSKFYNYVLVLATTATVSSHVYRDKLGVYGITVFELAAPKLVPLIESGKYEECNNAIKEYLSEIRFPMVSAVILGCTHYPLIEQYIKPYFKESVEIVNIGEIFSETVDFKKGNSSVTLYFSLINDNVLENVKRILNKDYQVINKVL